MIGSNCPEDSQRRNGGRRQVFRESIFFCRQRGSLGMEFHPPWTHVAGDDKLLSKPLVNGSRDGRRRTLVFIESESDAVQHGNGGHYQHDRLRMAIRSVLCRQDGRPEEAVSHGRLGARGRLQMLWVRRVSGSSASLAAYSENDAASACPIRTRWLAASSKSASVTRHRGPTTWTSTQRASCSGWLDNQTEPFIR